MDGKGIIVAGFFLVVLLGAVLTWRSGGSEHSSVIHSTPDVFSTFSDREVRQITIENTQLTVEVVNTPQSTTQGLSGRTEIGSDGMLFVFPTAEIRSFWMPDMQFNIDIVWIQNDRVHHVLSDVAKPLPQQTALPSYSSEVPVNVVLELPSGKAAELNIKPGSKVIY